MEPENAVILGKRAFVRCNEGGSLGHLYPSSSEGKLSHVVDQNFSGGRTVALSNGRGCWKGVASCPS
jgi:hypothetical protein